MGSKRPPDKRPKEGLPAHQQTLMLFATEQIKYGIASLNANIESEAQAKALPGTVTNDCKVGRASACNGTLSMEF